MEPLVVDPSRCNRDGLCVAECPARIVRMGAGGGCPEPVEGFAGVCIRCGHCVAVCPTAALSLDWLRPEQCAPIRRGISVSPEQAEQFLRGRRSVRTFQETRIGRSTLKKLLLVACSAPSAKNAQPWHWTVVEHPAEVRRLAGLVVDWMGGVAAARPGSPEAAMYAPVLAAWSRGHDRVCRGAPHLVVAHGDARWPFGAEDCALALGLMDLYATSLGLGACWAGYLYRAANAHPPLFEALGLPDGHRAFGALMVGHPRFRYPRIPVRNRPRVSWR